MKNDNGRNAIHFHAFRAWFKTQVTDCHQSDFAEALMGHTSLKRLLQAE
jgi:integrase